MPLSKKQLMALCDARAETNRDGLRKAGRKWYADRALSDGHDVRTIVFLADRGLLQFWANGEVAHITELGLDYLQEEGI